MHEGKWLNEGMHGTAGETCRVFCIEKGKWVPYGDSPFSRKLFLSRGAFSESSTQNQY